MMMTLERPAEARSEHNHSCTSQCSQPCQYTTSEVDTTLAPGMMNED